MSEQNPNHYIPKVALAASPVANTLRAYSASLGIWANQTGITVETTDIFKVGSIEGIDNN